jgi:23S rRNA (guanosine2251-2'-O)-methyltransferase
MAGNSQRRGAVRRPSSKKGPLVGSGGQSRKGLKGRGPTPKASERTSQSAARQAGAATRGTAGGASRGGVGGASRGGVGGASRGGVGAATSRRRATGTGSSEMVAGRNAVVEAMRAGVPVKALYVAARVESDDRVREALKLAADLDLPLLEASRTDLDRLTGGALHQGLVAQVPAYVYAHPGDLLEAAARTGRPPLLVALDGVTDPRNLGAVVRSAAAFGGHGVIVPERRAAGMTASAWKTSAGAAARIPVALAGNLTRALEDLRREGCFVVGLDAEGDVPLPGLALATEPLVLVIGSEGRGLSRLVREACDQVASIPMAAGTESLNAGVAAGVALYEVFRQRSG